MHTDPLLSGARTQVQTHTWTKMAGRRVPSAQNANYKRRGAWALASMHNTDPLVRGARTQVPTSPWTKMVGRSMPRYKWASYNTGRLNPSSPRYPWAAPVSAGAQASLPVTVHTAPLMGGARIRRAKGSLYGMLTRRHLIHRPQTPGSPARARSVYVTPSPNYT